MWVTRCSVHGKVCARPIKNGQRYVQKLAQFAKAGISLGRVSIGWAYSYIRSEEDFRLISLRVII